MQSHASSVFVSNNGLSDHIGIAQVVPYVTGLAMRGHRIRTISVERADRLETTGEQVFAGLHRAGVSTEVQTHRSGLMGVWERKLGLGKTLERLISESRPDLLHCRSYIPLASVMSASAKHRIPYVFDMRGFWIDQRIEGGVWKTANPLYRTIIGYFRHQEARALREAAAIVVLTEDAKQIVMSRREYKGAPVHVIPCSVDLSKFDFDQGAREEVRRELGVAADEVLLVYAGSTGAVYRTDQIFRVHAAANRSGLRTRLLFLGKHDPSRLLLEGRAHSAGLTPDDVLVRSVPHHEVSRYLSAADLGACFLVTSFSSLGVSATKVGEYLCCGLPVLANAGIGDIDKIVSEGESGFVVRDFSERSVEALVETIPALLQADRHAIRNKARQLYDLKRAIDRYEEVYRVLKS